MNLLCSKCGTALLPENINIVTDLGKCMNCDAILKVSQLVEQEKIEISNTPPEGSKIKVNSPEEGLLVIELPKNGFSKVHLPMLGFSILWIGFVAFWTIMASQGSFFFALFSIPFWFVGLSMIYGILKSSVSSQKISISKDALKVVHIKPFRSKTFELEIKSIQEVTFTNMKRNPYASIGKMQHSNSGIKDDAGRIRVEVPTILSYADKKTFFETASPEEQVWITSLLNDIVKKMNG